MVGEVNSNGNVADWVGGSREDAQSANACESALNHLRSQSSVMDFHVVKVHPFTLQFDNFISFF
jgi:hypothetical protein